MKSPSPRRICAWLAAVLSLCLAGAAPANQQGRGSYFDSRDVVEAELIVSTSAAPPGADVPLAIQLRIQKGWHIWTDDRALPADVDGFADGVRTVVSIVGAPSQMTLNLNFAQWPEFHRVEADFGEGKRVFAVFEGSPLIYIPASLAADATGIATCTIRVEFQACDDSTCKAPASVELPLSITVDRSATTGATADSFAKFDVGVYSRIHEGEAPDADVPFDILGWKFNIDSSGVGLLLLMLVAAIGGALLNFTPCVLPLIPLKIMGLARSAGNRSRCLNLGLAMGTGVIAFWLLLGSLIVTVTGFDTANALFQYRPFPIVMGIFIAIMAIGMAGFFSMRLPNWIQAIEPKHDTYGGSFLFGVMTAVLSTPCTAPFMGTAAGWAASSGSALTILSVFGAIGLGMATPYVVLAAFPTLVSRMPRAGAASEVVKQVMGLLLLAGAVYFIGSGINGYLEEASAIHWWVIATIAASAGAWMAWRTLWIARTPLNKVVFTSVGVIICAMSIGLGFIATYEPVDWVHWTTEREAEALQAHKVVVLDFTAEWCGNCKFLEATVLHTDAVAQALQADGVVPFKVDLTKGLPDRSARLAAAGRITIPLLVIIDTNGVEVFKADAYTPAQVLEALSRARN